jgi:hypothetical protein
MTDVCIFVSQEAHFSSHTHMPSCMGYDGAHDKKKSVQRQKNVLKHSFIEIERNVYCGGEKRGKAKKILDRKRYS